MGRGFRVLVGSCIFSTVTIGLVLWDENRQKTRRQEGVKYRLNSIQQKQNMAEYELQRQRYDDPHNRSWKKDIVYLYQFPRAARQPNLSPYCLKVETYLRIKQLKYEAIGTLTKKSKHGLMPFIELNGEQIPDSHLIILHLEKHFGISDGLSPYDRGVARAVDCMLDSYTLPAIQLDRLVLAPGRLTSRDVSGLPLPGFITDIIGKRLASVMEKRMRSRFKGMSDQEIRQSLKADYQAINDILGNKRYLFGEVPTAIDCSVFGHIGSFAFLPYRQLSVDILDDDFPKLKEYLVRIRSHYFPEWND